MTKWLIGLVGVAAALAAMTLLFAGGGLYVAERTLADADGFINSAPIGAEVDGYALVAGPAQIEVGPEIPFQLGELATLRVVAENQSPSQRIFLGVGPSEEVDTYLAGVPHALVESLEDETMTLSYRMAEEVTWTLPGPPQNEAFWTASVSGVGSQELVWELQQGDSSFVLMNADAADGLSAEIVVGARIPLLRSAAVILMIGGGVTLAIGVILIALVV